MSPGSEQSTNGSTAVESPSYEPSVADVLVTKALMNKALGLPSEIVNTIIDLAEYWPHTTTEASFRGSPLVCRSPGQEDVFVLRSAPLGLRSSWRLPPTANGSPNEVALPIERRPVKPHLLGEEFSTDDFQKLAASPGSMLAHPCRRIVFTTQSHDQGWGGSVGDRNTYNGSWTWFEAGLERWCKIITASGADAALQQAQHNRKPSLCLDDLCTVLPEVGDPAAKSLAFKHPLLPREDLKIQCNTTAESESRLHRIVWSYTDTIDPDRDVEAAARLEQEGRGTSTGNGKFVRDLKLGDVVTVWAKARFPGWANYVESVKIDVYFAV